MRSLSHHKGNLILTVTCFTALLAGCASEAVKEPNTESTAESAVEPKIQMTGPVIYLADNLGETGQRGWCIDTLGRGQGDQLHAHSCKPEGEDTQFSYDETTDTIRSVAYENQCMSFTDPENAKVPFGLVDCVDGDARQKFAYDTESMEIHIGINSSQCVVVAKTISDAGPYQSRDLIASSCDEVDPSRKQWVVRE